MLNSSYERNCFHTKMFVLYHGLDPIFFPTRQNIIIVNVKESISKNKEKRKQIRKILQEIYKKFQ